MKKGVLFLLAAASVLTSLPALATDTGTMICLGGLVSVGDTAGEVVHKCGQPATSTRREEKRVEKPGRGGAYRTDTTIAVEEWIFNFGPNQFQYQLTLENGRVAHIESLEYGY